MKELLGAVEHVEGDGKKTCWTRIGTAFENKDGSYNLRFDFLPKSERTKGSSAKVSHATMGSK